MAKDYGDDFIANPGAFIQNNAISLKQIDSKTPMPARQNNMIKSFTLTRETKWLGTAWADPIPSLRMLPGQAGDGYTTILSRYLYAGDGGDALDAIPYCDIPVAPGDGAPKFLFTVGMNGCTLVIATAVPGTATPLAANHWRVLHDHSHYDLARWHAGGYTLRFASYAGANEPGAVPPAFAGATVTNYNPNNYAWNYAEQGRHGVWMRVVTNFLHYDGNRWNYHSVHFHNYATEVNAVDEPPGGGGAGSSTRSMAV